MSAQQRAVATLLGLVDEALEANALHDALRPGGYLVLGKVETLVGAARERLELVDVRERLYRRPA